MGAHRDEQADTASVPSRLLLDALPVPIFAYDEDGRIVYANPAAAGFYRFEAPETLVGVHTEALTHPEDRAQLREAVGRGPGRPLVLRQVLRDGTVRVAEGLEMHVELDATPARVVVLHDVTEREVATREALAAERRLFTILDRLGAGVTVYDAAGNVTMANAAALAMYGVASLDDLLGADVTELLRPIDEHGQPIELPSRRCLRTGEPVTATRVGVRGGELWLSAAAVPFVDRDGELVGVIVSFSDVTAEHRMQADLSASEAQFRVLAEQAPMGIFTIHQPSGHLYVNDAFREISGLGDEPPSTDRWLALVHPDDRELATQAWEAVHVGARETSFDIRIVRPDGRARTVHVRAVKTAGGGAGAGDGRFLGMVVDVTADREREARLAHDATHDVLTGLANRALLDDRLSRAITRAARTGTAVGVLYVDLDRFKPVNDAHGHAAGDDVLRQLATRLRRAVRPADTVARVGGDEFVVLLDPPVTPDEAEAVASRVLACVEEPFVLADGTAVSIGASVGLALRTGDDSADEVLAAADAAVYRAKSAGRGRIVRA